MTEECSFTLHDKTHWLDGPWKEEPDRVQWISDPGPLPCLVVRSDYGHLCGYVGIAAEHPLYGMGYNEFIPEWCTCPGNHDGLNFDCDSTPGERLPAHHGLTYAGVGDPDETLSHIVFKMEGGPLRDVWYFGFDCAHYTDLQPEMARMYPGLVSGRGAVYRDLPYVRGIVDDLARELCRYSESLNVPAELRV